MVTPYPQNWAIVNDQQDPAWSQSVLGIIANQPFERSGTNRIVIRVSCASNAQQLGQGEFVSVMGPSGSGKSTLLYNISGMDRMTGGSVVFDQQKLETFSEGELSRLRLRKMGFIFQQIHLLKNLTVKDNIIVSACLAKERSHKEINRKAMGLMEKTGIAELADINRSGTTILLVTHEVKVASKTERVLFMLDGEIAGEYRLGKCVTENGDEKGREEELSRWLLKMGF